nr:probable ATP-dependent RNA helicase vasa-like [Halyomorpha halys]
MQAPGKKTPGWRLRRGWNGVTYTRPRNNPVPWRRKDQRDVGRERGSGDRRTNQAKPRNNGRREERSCHGCGKTGHLVAQCPRTRCLECGNEGHIARRCPYMYRRKEANLGEPMEVNAQRVRRRREPHRPDESSSDISEISEASGTDVEDEETRRPNTSRNGWRRASGRRGSTEEI